MSHFRLGFLGFGEVGFTFSKSLKAAGVNGISAYDRDQENPAVGDLIKKRAETAGVELLNSATALAKAVDIVFCAVPGTAAVSAAKDASPGLSSGKLYVDLTSAKPPTKAEVGAVVNATGAQFVDAAIVAPVPQFAHRVAIFASGSGSQGFYNQMTPFGMDIRIVSSEPGQASLLKMLRSSFTKGLEALLLETMFAARRLNAEEAILSSISETMDGAPFANTVNRHICENAIHAKRRVHEMEDVASVIKNAGVEPIMVGAAIQRLQWSADFNLKEYFHGEPPASYKQVLAAFEEIAGERVKKQI